MRKDAILSVAGPIDFTEFFRSCLDFLIDRGPVVTFWGIIPEASLDNLASFSAGRRGLRATMVKERDYGVTHESKGEFLCACVDIDLGKTAWGMRVGEDGIVLAKSPGEVTLSGNAAVSAASLEGFLANLVQEGVVGGFEKITDG